MNLRELMLEGLRILETNKRPDAAIDSKLLLMELLGYNAANLLLHYSDPVEEHIVQQYRELIYKRAEGVPLQHITNEQEFMGLPFYVDERVLIPRQDTETLVETILEYADKINLEKAVEVGVGSGCISVSLAHYLKKLHIIGIDLSKDALEVARRNIQQNHMEERVTLLESDVFTNYTGEPGTLDLIVSNPPYISTEECKELMTEVIKYEPYMALTDGGDGLKFYREITKAAKVYLREGGLLAYEIGCSQGSAVCELLQKEGFREVRLIQDLAQRDRVVVGIK